MHSERIREITQEIAERRECIASLEQEAKAILFSSDKVVIYRITQTNIDGQVVEHGWQSMKERAKGVADMEEEA